MPNFSELPVKRSQRGEAVPPPLLARIRETFSKQYGCQPTAVAFAPGRIEFIGNHTDYNGGPVLGAAIDRGVWVATAPRDDARYRLASTFAGDELRVVEVPARMLAKGVLEDRWINYPLGVLSVLPFFGFPAPAGFDYLAVSDVPAGAGLSSSAAIELASALAFLALTGRSCARETLAQIGRKAENEFVGVPCGILDQGVSAFGAADCLVRIDCRNLVFDRLPFAPEANLWVFNTHAKHALVDGLYAQRHRECQEAAGLLGVPLLAVATAGQLENAAGRMPAPLARRARHVIEETARVRRIPALLAQADLAAVGRLLTQSHRSSQHFFENSAPELDFLVDTLLEMPGVHGARLTGGGFGGAVLALTGPEFSSDDAGMVASLYQVRYKAEPEVFKFRCGEGAHLLPTGTAAGVLVPSLVGEAHA